MDLREIVEEAGYVPTDPALTTKENAVNLLRCAAEIEHAFVVQYLNAAFTLDGSVTGKKWARTLREIAREEMGHLATVQNLLMLLGEDPWLGRPSYPVKSPDYKFESNIRPFGVEWLMNFVAAESPKDAPDLPPEIGDLGSLIDHVGVLYGILYWLFTSPTMPGPWPVADPMIGIGQLEDSDFADPAAASERLLGSEEWSASDNASEPDGVHVLASNTYATVTAAREAALAAIYHVAIQGEGPVGGSANSHYQRLLAVYTSAKVTHPLPILDVGTNLHVAVDPAAPPTDPTLITNPRARTLVQIFNLRYWLILVAIGHIPQIPRTNQTLRYELASDWMISFEMVAVLGPLAKEIEAEAVQEGVPSPKAGPTFELPASLPATVAERKAFYLRIFQDTKDLADTLAPPSPTVMDIVAKDIEHKSFVEANF